MGKAEDFKLHHYWRSTSTSPSSTEKKPIIERRVASIPARLNLLESNWKDDNNYTSLRHLLKNGGGSSHGDVDEIKIKNRLVNRAAYAYLQPTTPPGFDYARRFGRRGMLRRALSKLSCGYVDDHIESFFDFLGRVFRPNGRR